MKRRCIMPTHGYLPYQGWAFLFIFLKLVYKSSPSLGHCLPKPWALPPQPLGIVCPILLFGKSSDDDFTYFAIGVTYDANSRTRTIEASSIERVISYDAILFARHDVVNA